MTALPPGLLGPNATTLPSSSEPAAAPGSPEWWRDRLAKRLDAQVARVDRLEAYFDGDHPLPQPPAGLTEEVFREALRAFTTLARMGVTNWVRMIARAPAERLAVTGFRFGESLAGDDVAWGIWQRNHLDADSRLAHDTSLALSTSYVTVWADQDGQPQITPEHPSQAIIAYEAGSRWRRAAALKRWVDEDGTVYATVYLPDAVYKFFSPFSEPHRVRWMRRELPREPWPLPNALGVVPMVELPANSGLKVRPYGGGMSEFEPVLSIQDRINKTVFDRLVTAESQAFRQRVVTGWEPVVDPVTKKPDPRATYKASQSILWTFPEPTTKVHDLAQADFAPFLRAVESDVAVMAAITQTPPTYLLGTMINVSGDALQAAEAGLVAKTRAHRDGFGEAWEEVIRLALKVAGDRRAEDMSSAVLWGDIEHVTWAQKVDALTKLDIIGVPREELWTRIPGVSPQDVARWKQMQAAELTSHAHHPERAHLERDAEVDASA